MEGNVGRAIGEGGCLEGIFVYKMLVKDENDGTLCLRRKSKSAMIWWKKQK